MSVPAFPVVSKCGPCAENRHDDCEHKEALKEWEVKLLVAVFGPVDEPIRASQWCCCPSVRSQ